jgi:hypothetical protein
MNKDKEKKPLKEMSRRDFLVGASTLAVGGALGSGILAGCKGETITETVQVTTTKTMPTTVEIPTTITGIPVTTTATTTATTTETVMGPITLEVLNPRGEVDPPPVVAPNPRLDTLDGKTVALYWNSKQNGYVFWDRVEELLEEAYPTITILRYNGGFEITDKVAAQVVSDGADAFMYGMGD